MAFDCRGEIAASVKRVHDFIASVRFGNRCSSSFPIAVPQSLVVIFFLFVCVGSFYVAVRRCFNAIMAEYH